MVHHRIRVAAAWKGLAGATKQLLGRLTANRLLEFEGQQDRLEARLRTRGIAPPLRLPRALALVRRG